jgi:hypothetical protein
MVTDPNNAVVAKLVVLAQTMGLSVTAEGMECRYRLVFWRT